MLLFILLHVFRHYERRVSLDYGKNRKLIEGVNTLLSKNSNSKTLHRNAIVLNFFFLHLRVFPVKDVQSNSCCLGSSLEKFRNTHKYRCFRFFQDFFSLSLSLSSLKLAVSLIQCPVERLTSTSLASM